jgi:hypothetical protein
MSVVRPVRRQGGALRKLSAPLQCRSVMATGPRGLSGRDIGHAALVATATVIWLIALVLVPRDWPSPRYPHLLRAALATLGFVLIAYLMTVVAYRRRYWNAFQTVLFALLVSHASPVVVAEFAPKVGMSQPLFTHFELNGPGPLFTWTLGVLAIVLLWMEYASASPIDAPVGAVLPRAPSSPPQGDLRSPPAAHDVAPPPRRPTSVLVAALATLVLFSGAALLGGKQPLPKYGEAAHDQLIDLVQFDPLFTPDVAQAYEREIALVGDVGRYKDCTGEQSQLWLLTTNASWVLRRYVTPHCPGFRVHIRSSTVSASPLRLWVHHKPSSSPEILPVGKTFLQNEPIDLLEITDLAEVVLGLDFIRMDANKLRGPFRATLILPRAADSPGLLRVSAARRMRDGVLLSRPLQKVFAAYSGSIDFDHIASTARTVNTLLHQTTARNLEQGHRA